MWISNEIHSTLGELTGCKQLHSTISSPISHFLPLQKLTRSHGFVMRWLLDSMHSGIFGCRFLMRFTALMLVASISMYSHFTALETFAQSSCVFLMRLIDFTGCQHLRVQFLLPSHLLCHKKHWHSIIVGF